LQRVGGSLFGVDVIDEPPPAITESLTLGDIRA
jgi:hypothetical protein